MNDGSTILHCAADKGHFAICKLIIDQIQIKNPLAGLPSEALIINSIQIINPSEVCDCFGNTPLHKAAEKGYLKIVEYIMKFIDDKNPKNSNNWTPLHEAAYNGHLSIVNYIMSNIRGDKNPESNGKWTPLKYAAYKGHTEIVDYIKKVISNQEENNNESIRTRSQKRAFEMVKNVTSTKSGDDNFVYQKSKKKKNY